MNRIPQLCDAIHRALNQSARGRVVLPGGVWFNRVPEDSPLPYGTVMIEADDIAFVGVVTLIRYRVTVRCYATPDMRRVTRIAKLLDGFDWQESKLRVADVDKVVAVAPVNPGELMDDDLMRDASDVLVSVKQWNITLQVSS